MACTALLLTIQIAVNSAELCSHLPKLSEQQFLRLLAQHRPMTGAYKAFHLHKVTNITLHLHEVLLCLVEKITLPLRCPSAYVSMLFNSLFKPPARPSSTPPGVHHQADQKPSLEWLFLACF